MQPLSIPAFSLTEKEAELLLTGKKQSIAVALFQQKIHFVGGDLSQRIDNLQNITMSVPSKKEALVRILASEIMDGHAVITTKTTNGRLRVIATEEMAKKLKSGEVTLQSKKGKVKEIAEIQIVDALYFKKLASTLSSQKTADVQPVEPKLVEPVQPKLVDVVIEPKFTKTLLAVAIYSAFQSLSSQKADDAFYEGVERAKKRAQEAFNRADEKLRDVIRHEIKKDEIKKSAARREAISIK